MASDTNTDVRVGISFIINFAPNHGCSENHIFAVLHTLGLNVAVKTVTSLKGKDKKDSLASEVATALKDHNSDYGAEVMAESNDYLRNLDANRSDEETTASFFIVNTELRNILTTATDNLKGDGWRVTVAVVEESVKMMYTYRSAEPKGLELALEKVREFMMSNDYALHRGAVYTKPIGAMDTYTYYFTVEQFVNRLMGNRNLSTFLLPHANAVIKMLQNHACDYIRQIKINYDLIEVRDGMAWSVSSMTFVRLHDMPDSTPRAYCDFDATTDAHGGFFKESVINSFQDPTCRAQFLLKWYQLLLHERFLHKTRKLMVCGPKDSGKSTWVLPIMSIIPKQNVASLTKEKQFSCSMLNDETQLVFVDEFTDELLTPDQAKAVLQGGFMPVSMKHKTARTVEYNSPFFITAQKVPDWVEEDANVKRRLAIFNTKPLSTRPEVAEWLKANPIECIVWAARAVLANRNLVEEDELFFLPEKAMFNSRDRKKEEMEQHECKIRKGRLEEAVLHKDQMVLTSAELSNELSDSVHDGEVAGPSRHLVETSNDSDVMPPLSSTPMKEEVPSIDFQVSFLNEASYMAEVNETLNGMKTSSVDYLSHLRKKERLQLERVNRIVHHADTSLTQKSNIRKSLLKDTALLYDSYDPQFDAWSCITGENRVAFDIDAFWKLYPSQIKRVSEVRNRLMLRPKAPRTDEIRHLVSKLVETVVLKTKEYIY